MTCKEFQDAITDFIDEKMELSQMKAFGEHAAFCPECREELEIYFATMTAVRQLDEGKDTIDDYTSELQHRLDHLQVILRTQRNLSIRRIILLVLMMVVYLVLYR